MGNNQYDSILKEKDNFENEDDAKHKYFKLLIFFGFLISIVIVVVSYFIYYNTILDNESIFFNNLSKVEKYYSKIYDDVSFSYNINDNYLIDGDIDVGNDNFKYSFVKDGSKIKRVIFNNDKSVSYFEDGSYSYFKISSLGDYYIKEKTKLNDLNYYLDNIEQIRDDFNTYLYSSVLDKSSYDLFNQIYNLNNLGNIIGDVASSYRSNISSDKYIRKIYFDNKKPVVEVNLILDKNQINNILNSSNLNIDDDYQINITMKNNAITNGIIDIKVVINNKTKNVRRLLEYKNNIMYYTDKDGNKYSFLYNKDKNNIQIKKNDVLYSAIQIASRNKTNIYTYKVIDKIYTVSLSVEKLQDNFEYSIETNIDNVPKAFNVRGNYKKSESINDDFSKAVSVDSLSIEQQNLYKEKISELLK